MTYSDYKHWAASELPTLNLPLIVNMPPPECLKAVALELFVMDNPNATLVRETRDQLLHLNENGITNFNEG